MILDEWGGMCNVGHQQSPIDIDASYVRYNKTIHGLIFHYDEEEYTASIRLRHHSGQYMMYNRTSYVFNCTYKISALN